MDERLIAAGGERAGCICVSAAANCGRRCRTTDTIKAIDAAMHTVTLGDGNVYRVPSTGDLSKMKVGDKVKITFTTDAAGKSYATAVAAAA